MCFAYKYKEGILCVTVFILLPPQLLTTIKMVAYLLFPGWKEYTDSDIKPLQTFYTNTFTPNNDVNDEC